MPIRFCSVSLNSSPFRRLYVVLPSIMASPPPPETDTLYTCVTTTTGRHKKFFTRATYHLFLDVFPHTLIAKTVHFDTQFQLQLHSTSYQMPAAPTTKYRAPAQHNPNSIKPPFPTNIIQITSYTEDTSSSAIFILRFLTKTGSKCWFLKEKTFLATVPSASLSLSPLTTLILEQAIQNFVIFRTRDTGMGPSDIKVERGRKRSANGYAVSFNQHMLVTTIRTPIGDAKAKFIDTIATSLGCHIKGLYQHKDFLPLLRSFCSPSMWLHMVKTGQLTYSDFFCDCSIQVRSTDDLNLFIVRDDARTAVDSMLYNFS